MGVIGFSLWIRLQWVSWVFYQKPFLNLKHNCSGCHRFSIAHYEGGRLRLVASIIPLIASAVSSTVVELMGEVTTQEVKSKRGPKSKFELQIEQVHKLPRTKQKFVSEMLDTVIQQATH